MKFPSMPAMPAMPAMPGIPSTPSMGNMTKNLPSRAKLGLHGIQAVLIFIAWSITIALLVQSGSSGSGPKFYFAMCWLSIPVLIYQAAVPQFPKTRTFANPYAFAALDILFTILWLAAFSAVLVWTNNGIREGAEKKKLPEGNCTTFEYGTERKCNLGKASGGLGGFIFACFVLTSGISIYGLLHFRKTGTMWGASSKSDPASIEAQTRDAFSAADQHDGTPAGGATPEDDEYALLHESDNLGSNHNGRPSSWGEGGVHGDQGLDTAGTAYHSHYADAHQTELDDGRISPLEPEYPEPLPGAQPYGDGPYGYGGGHGAAPPYSR